MHMQRKSPAARQRLSTGGSAEFESDLYDTRWRLVSAERSSLAVELTEAEVLWGTTADLAAPLDQCMNDLRRAIRAHLREVSNAPGQLESEDVIQARERTLYDQSSDGTDEFSRRVASAVTQIDRAVTPFLRSRGRPRQPR